MKIFFDPNVKSKTGKYIPLSLSPDGMSEPHQCPKKRYEMQAQRDWYRGKYRKLTV